LILPSVLKFIVFNNKEFIRVLQKKNVMIIVPNNKNEYATDHLLFGIEIFSVNLNGLFKNMYTELNIDPNRIIFINDLVDSNQIHIVREMSGRSILTLNFSSNDPEDYSGLESKINSLAGKILPIGLSPLNFWSDPLVADRFHNGSKILTTNTFNI